MILLDNLILLILLTALFAAATYLSLSMKQKLVFAAVSALTELGTVLLLLFKGASIEELFLMILVFGCVTVSLNYFKKEPVKADRSDADPKENE